MNRDLDAKIAKDIFNWKYTDVGKDANNENTCKILTEDGNFPKDIDLPCIGVIGEAYLVPLYSNDLYLSLKLAKHVNLDTSITDLPLNPEKIAELSYDHFMKKRKKIERINIIIKFLQGKYPKIVFINAMEKRLDMPLSTDYAIVAFRVPRTKMVELQGLVYNYAYIELIEDGEDWPLFMTINK